ncbi:putative quinol monooxygenase [Kribbella sp. NPDC050124]|uniref:putative quinol monooxygenase n=1 Tax=Kribbella sp. NPDC050124 TaxID=3364114 RepID=UPI003796F741
MPRIRATGYSIPERRTEAGTVIRTMLKLRAIPDRRPALIDHYREHRVLAASAPYGCLSGELAVDPNNDQAAFVTSRWPSAAAYEDWLSSPVRDGIMRGLQELLDPSHPPEIQILDVIDEVSTEESS